MVKSPHLSFRFLPLKIFFIRFQLEIYQNSVSPPRLCSQMQMQMQMQMHSTPSSIIHTFLIHLIFLSFFVHLSFSPSTQDPFSFVHCCAIKKTIINLVPQWVAFPRQFQLLLGSFHLQWVTTLDCVANTFAIRQWDLWPFFHWPLPQ